MTGTTLMSKAFNNGSLRKAVIAGILVYQGWLGYCLVEIGKDVACLKAQMQQLTGELPVDNSP